MSKESLLQVKFKSWHECVDKIRPEAAERLDTGDYAYSQDFEYLIISIASTSINKDEVKAALGRLTYRKMNLPSDDFKTEVGKFITYTTPVYENANEARSYLKENGWLPRPDSGDSIKPKPSQPAPEQPKPQQEDNYQPKTKPRQQDNYRPKPKPMNTYRQPESYKPSIFDKINDVFEQIRFRLDIVLKYLEQYTENIFYILFGTLALAGIIYTFYTGHWVWGIIEIFAASCLGIYALAIGGVLTKWFLKSIVVLLKYFFYRWWMPLLIALIIGGGVTYKYMKEGWNPNSVIQKVEQKEHKTEQKQQKTKSTTAKDAPRTESAKQGAKTSTQTKQTTQQSKPQKQTTQKQQQTSSAQQSPKKQTEPAPAPKPAPKLSEYEQNISAANAGNAAACYTIAQCYMNGDGVATDKYQAFQYMKKAADGGYTKAYIEVAKMYHGGRGVTKDRNEAERWYKKAADSGNAEAKRILQNM